MIDEPYTLRNMFSKRRRRCWKAISWGGRKRRREVISAATCGVSVIPLHYTTRDKSVKLRPHLFVGPSSCRLSQAWAFEYLELRLSAGCTLALLVRVGEHDWAGPCYIVTRFRTFQSKCCPCESELSFSVMLLSLSSIYAVYVKIRSRSQLTSTTMDATTTISPTGKVSVDPSIVKCT